MPPAEGAGFEEPPIRRIDDGEVERLVLHLAASLRECLGEDLRRSLFLPIPRGGFVVLGLLAYALDLDRERFAPSPRQSRGDSGPVVLVDDCGLTGARFDRVISAVAAERVIFATLLSPASLRRAISSERPGTTCLSGDDLVERAPESDSGAEIWRERLSGRRYWLGGAEPIAFPWSEPETVWWNAQHERVEDGWRRASPRLTLRGRAALDLPPEAAEPIPEGRDERFDLAPSALWKLERAAERHGDEARDRLSIRSADDRLYGFTGTALEVWRTLLAGGDREAAAKHLSTVYEVAEAEALRDVDDLVEGLLDRGLLVRRDSGSGGASTG